MRVHTLQHVPFEGPAAIADWSCERGHPLTTTKAYDGEPYPGPGELDLLVVMGGPMSVRDVAAHPWIPSEIRLIEACIRLEKPVLGVCLGAQLMASALGAPVYPAPEKEIGWYPVRLTREAREQTLLAGAPDVFVPLHWHGETFDLPAGCTRLAGTAVCPNQAFQLAGTALAMQFHLESTEASVRALVAACADEITEGRFQQSPAEILRGVSRATAARTLLFDILDRLQAASSV